MGLYRRGIVRVMDIVIGKESARGSHAMVMPMVMGLAVVSRACVCLATYIVVYVFAPIGLVVLGGGCSLRVELHPLDRKGAATLAT